MVLIGTVSLLHKFIVDTIGLVFYTTELQIGKYIPVVGKTIVGLNKGAIVILMGIRIIVFILTIAAQELVFCCLIGNIGEIAPVVATELLKVQSANNIPVFILVVGVIHDAIGVLGQPLLAHKVGTLYEIAVCIIEGETKLSKFRLALELVVVAITIGVVYGKVVTPMVVGSPNSRKDIVVLIEIVGGLVPKTTITHGVRHDGIVALAVAHQSCCQDIELPETSSIHILIGIDTIAHQREVGVIVAGEHTIPCLAGLFKVADILVAHLEIVSKPCQSTIVRT